MIIAASEFIDEVHLKSRECSVLDSEVQTAFTSGEKCNNFRREARLKRRTHLNFLTGAGNGDNHDLQTTEQTSKSGNGVEVTLATQLTISRFPGLERMLSVWDGPASVAFHVKDDEVDRLTSMITESAALKKRKNVVYHVVYKRLVRKSYKDICYVTRLHKFTC
jgi:Glycosyl-transferase for dystroglycan